MREGLSEINCIIERNIQKSRDDFPKEKRPFSMEQKKTDDSGKY